MDFLIRDIRLTEEREHILKYHLTIILLMTKEVVSDLPPAKRKGILLKYDYKRMAAVPLKFLKIISFFPMRFMICGFFIAYVLLGTTYLQTFQNQITVSLFQILHVQAYVDGDTLYVGSLYSSIQFPSLHKLEVLFLIFFLSFAITTASGFQTRLRMLLYGFLCLIALIVTESLIALTMVAIRSTSIEVFVEANMLVMPLVAIAFLEKSLFAGMILPRSSNVKPVLKTSYVVHYLYLAATIVGAALVGYAFLKVFQLSTNYLFLSFAAVSINEIFILKTYLANLIYEVKVPTWTKKTISQPPTGCNNMFVSFLIPAYNEEENMKRCIEGFDKLASKYPGKTEIIVINDGSTDNTRKIASEAILNLKHSSGRVYNIPHSGLVPTLQYGYQKVKGDFIFRADSDGTIQEDALNILLPHFNDPQVASLSGAIIASEEEVWWQKIQTVNASKRILLKRNAELLDSILTNPGSFTIFRKDALVKVGGWIYDLMGEDNELTTRLGRYGYRHEFDPDAIQFGGAPRKWKDLVLQRVRWGMGYYQTVSANSNVLKEFRPLSVQFALGQFTHGIMILYTLFVPYLIAYMITQYTQSSSSLSNLFAFWEGFIIIMLPLQGLKAISVFYFLRKFKKTNLMKYFPLSPIFFWLVQAILGHLPAAEIQLYVANKFKGRIHSSELNQALRQRSKEEVSSVFD